MSAIPPLDPPRLAPTSGQVQNPYGSNTPSYGEWFTVSLGGQVIPGKWKCTSGAIKIKYDPKKKPGVDGGNPVFHGLQPQQFELEGEQFADDERNALQPILTKILPQPGSSQDSKPMLLQHPSVLIFGYAINVKVIGCSIMEHTGPGTSRVRISLQHWMPPKQNAASATVQPTQATRNLRAEAARKQSPPNPVPTANQSIAGPPLNFTPGPGQ